MNNSKGLTLVELLISLLIISILVFAFTTFFSWNVTSIFDTGKRSEAIARAEKKLEELYYKEDRERYFSDNKYLSDPSEDEYVANINEVTSYSSKARQFSVVPYEKTYEEDGITKTVKGYSVTVVSFYQNGERYVTLTSFIEAD